MITGEENKGTLLQKRSRQSYSCYEHSSQVLPVTCALHCPSGSEGCLRQLLLLLLLTSVNSIPAPLLGRAATISSLSWNMILVSSFWHNIALRAISCVVAIPLYEVTINGLFLTHQILFSVFLLCLKPRFSQL